MTSGTGAAYANGRLGRRGGGHVLFGRMYEDSSIELQAFTRSSRIFAIASAGCTAMALSVDHEVVAVDINPTQLAYAERRLQGEPACTGTAESLMSLARRLGPVAGWWRPRVLAFLELTDVEQQLDCWRHHLDTRRFRLSVDALLSLTSLRAVYAPAFLDFLPAGLGAVMRGRLQRCIARHPNAGNPYLRSLLLGDGPSVAPPRQASNMRLVLADAAEFLERQPSGSFDGFTMSNILDGADVHYEKRLSDAVQRAATPDAVIVRRSFRNPPHSTATNLAQDDRAALWGIVDVRPVHEPP